MVDEQKEQFRFTSALSNGRDLFAFRYAVNDKANSLYFRETGESLLVVSEPIDRDRERWTEVPENHVLIAREGRPVEVSPVVGRRLEAAE
jgi:glutamine amidotransferase